MYSRPMSWADFLNHPIGGYAMGRQSQLDKKSRSLWDEFWTSPETGCCPDSFFHYHDATSHFRSVVEFSVTSISYFASCRLHKQTLTHINGYQKNMFNQQKCMVSTKMRIATLNVFSAWYIYMYMYIWIQMIITYKYLISAGFPAFPPNWDNHR